MGKGLNKRHRLKKVEESKYNNLPKAALGKASPFPKLPDAPKPEDLVDHVPRSLRKFMTLKDAADKERLRKAALKERHAAQAALASAPAAPVAPQAPPAGPQRRQPRAGKSSKQAGPGTPGPGSQQAVEQAGGLASSGGMVPADTPRVYKTSAFEQVVKKTLKPRKKEYLERRKLMKKQGGKGPRPPLTQAELKLQAQQALTQAKFGEVAAAPLQVQLKRKHWAAEEAAGGQGAGGQAQGAGLRLRGLTHVPQGQRMKAIMMSQLAGVAGQRQGKAAGGPAAAASAAAPRKVKGTRPHTGQVRQVQSPPGGLLAAARAQAQVQQQKQEQEAVRQQAVAAYRSHKRQRGAGPVGTASMASLAALVHKGAAGGSNTHVLC